MAWHKFRYLSEIMVRISRCFSVWIKRNDFLRSDSVEVLATFFRRLGRNGKGERQRETLRTLSFLYGTTILVALKGLSKTGFHEW